MDQVYYVSPAPVIKPAMGVMISRGLKYPTDLSTLMKCVASVSDPRCIPEAEEAGADLVELRLDLFPPNLSQDMKTCVKRCTLPLIITVRSRQEGGYFRGSPDDWWRLVLPWLSYATLVDVEQDFSMLTPLINDAGAEVIASFHSGRMLIGGELGAIATRLRAYGTPKVVVRPESPIDVLTLCWFTHRTEKPVITSVIGSQYRYARVMLPLFGSEMAFGYAGQPTAEGQFHVREMRQMVEALMG
ncbi:MAG TPA: type I 3-dehydroquinate dehydratase [Methanoregulaceae archaeon]|nr:type I 3-dehydroquinate dehydratase [Methanoregulaceae archaeon]HNL86349.1 type I 3-dehydroquinate dehydratase [Methanoregulaceae archaeon]